MELILFCGIQATGKSTFFKENFFHTHVRLSLDLLNTRNKERKFLNLCFELQQKVVIDNTNPTLLDRKKYLDLAKEHKYKTISYYFESKLKESLLRNEVREGKQKIKEVGIIATAKKLILPKFEEGFDEMYYVSLQENKGFIIKDWKNEV